MIRRLSGNPTILTLLVLVSAILVWRVEMFDASNPVKSFGILGGILSAVWTFYLFLLRGSFETSLAMDLSVDAQPRDSQFVVYLQVKLSNIGGRRITAPPTLSSEQIKDYEHSVIFPCDLELRVLNGTISTPCFVGWWSKRAPLKNIEGIPTHISVLYEYTRADEKVDFFMEPGESYVLGHVLVLPAGNYVAKLVFVGQRATAAEYWSRIFSFSVPRLPVLPAETATRS